MLHSWFGSRGGCICICDWEDRQFRGSWNSGPTTKAGYSLRCCEVSNVVELEDIDGKRNLLSRFCDVNRHFL